MSVETRVVAWMDDKAVWFGTRAPTTTGQKALVLADDYEEAIAALAEITAWVDRAIVPGYDEKRKPMPINCANALAKAHAALAKASE